MTGTSFSQVSSEAAASLALDCCLATSAPATFWYSFCVAWVAATRLASENRGGISARSFGSLVRSAGRSVCLQTGSGSRAGGAQCGGPALTTNAGGAQAALKSAGPGVKVDVYSCIKASDFFGRPTIVVLATHLARHGRVRVDGR
eukprot:SAG22_NODE_7088_length_778_cov_1.160530_1_plen_145_part_00